MEILGGTGRDGIFLGKILGGTGRLFFFFEAGRGGCFFFPRRDGAVVFFSEAGRGGCIFFSRGDGTGWLCFFSAGIGRLYFLFAPGRAFFFQRRDGAVNGCCFQRWDGIVYTRAKRGGVTFCEKCHGGGPDSFADWKR